MIRFPPKLPRLRSTLRAILLPAAEALRLAAARCGMATGAVNPPARRLAPDVACPARGFSGPGGVRLFMALADRDGRIDQGAAQVAQHGWTGFEPPLPAVLAAALRQWPGRVVDAGANSGFYTLLAASLPGCRQVIACEPDPDILALLRFNIACSRGGAPRVSRRASRRASARVSQRIVVRALALSDRAGTAMLHLPDPGHGLVETSGSLDVALSVAVATARLDDVVGDGPPVSVIKIDLEGHEPAVLRGGERTIRHDRPLLFVEILPAADLDFMERWLAAHHYADVPLLAAGPLGEAARVVFEPSAWNHAFVPRERLGRFLEIAGAVVGPDRTGADATPDNEAG